MRPLKIGQAGGLAAVLLALLLMCFPPRVQAQEATPAEPALVSKQAPGEITSGPKDAGERTGVYVFLVWLWSVLIVLVFILRAKVREVDRLHDMRYFTK